MRHVKLSSIAAAIKLALMVVSKSHIMESLDDELSIKPRTPRQLFATWRRTTEAAIIMHDMRQHQLGLCPICKGTLGVSPHLDHIKPLAKLSTDESHLITALDNLVLLCESCNKRKGARLFNLHPGDVPHLSDLLTSTKKSTKKKDSQRD